MFIRSCFRGYANQQVGLVLLVCLPCIAIATLSYIYLSIYLFSFIVTVQVLLFVYVLANTRERVNRQLQVLSNLIEALIEGDYSLRGKEQPEPSFQVLLSLLNHLAETLQKQSLKIVENQLLLEKILNQMDTLIFALDDEDKLVMANRSAFKLLFPDKQCENFVSARLEEVDRVRLADTSLSFLENEKNSGVVIVDSESFSGEFFLFKDHFMSDGKKQNLFLLTRAESLLREKETQAWQGLLRVLSHELNNSLTPIATISRAMKRKLSNGLSQQDVGYYSEGMAIIDERAESLKSFIQSYKEFMYLPPPNKTLVAIDEVLKNTTKLFSQCEFQFSHSWLGNWKSINVLVDKNQIEQVFINLIKNAYEASVSEADMNLHETKSCTRKVSITIDCTYQNCWLNVYVKDAGEGIANPDNLFVPMYTTKKNGSGTGLNLCQQIVHNHQGQLIVRNQKNSPGAEAIVCLPATPSFL